MGPATLSRARQAIAAFFLLLVASCATPAPAQPAAAASAAAARQLTPAELKEAWSRDNRWRYHDEAEADAAYDRLVARQLPWPEWHQVHVVFLQPGLRFEMALGPGQSPDSPGAFGTFDHIPDVRFVRYSLAVKTKWKKAIDRVVTYEVIEPLPADTGLVGPQIDSEAGLYLPGGASQLQMQVPSAERRAHLKIVAVRPIE